MEFIFLQPWRRSLTPTSEVVKRLNLTMCRRAEESNTLNAQTAGCQTYQRHVLRAQIPSHPEDKLLIPFAFLEQAFSFLNKSMRNPPLKATFNFCFLSPSSLPDLNDFV